MTQKPLTNIKKSERERARSNSEAHVLKQFEKFFLFEFYVRYLKLSRNKEITQLLTLKDSIRQRFIDLKMVERLTAYTFSFEEAPEFRYPLEMDLEGLTDWTLNAIQFSRCQLFLLNSDLAYVTLSKEDSDGLITPFRELKDSIEPDLKHLYYRFSDLTAPNDIKKVLNWWTQNLDQDFRREQKLLGNLGLVCVSHVDWDEINANQDVLNYSFPEFLAPEVIFFKKTNYDLYNSNEVEVNINGRQLGNSIVLSIQFDQDAANIAEIIREFLRTFYGEQNKWLMDTIDSRSGPIHIFDIDDKSVSSFRKASSHNYHLVKKKDTSISKYLCGLIFYDAYKQEQEKQRRKKQQQAVESLPKKNRRKTSEEDENKSREALAEDILNNNPVIKLTVDSLVDNYHDVRKAILGINKIFIKTFPTEKSRFQNNTI